MRDLEICEFAGFAGFGIWPNLVREILGIWLYGFVRPEIFVGFEHCVLRYPRDLVIVSGKLAGFGALGLRDPLGMTNFPQFVKGD